MTYCYTHHSRSGATLKHVFTVLLGLIALAALAFAQTSVGPGILQVGSSATASNASSTKAGSVLFFHKYTSDNSSPSSINTVVNLTNTNPNAGVTVRLFAVHDFTTDEKFVNLGANQSRSLLMSKEFPNTTGYLVAVAVNSTGAPTQFNWIIGSASCKDWAGYEGSYNAFAVARRAAGSINENAGGFDLVFDGIQYDRLPQQIGLDNFKTSTAALALYSPVTRLGSDAPNVDLTLSSTIFTSAGKAVSSDLSGFSLAFFDIASSLWYDQNVDALVNQSNPGFATFSARDVTDIRRAKSVPVLGIAGGVVSSSHLENSIGLPVLNWLQTFTIRMEKKVPSNPAVDTASFKLPDASAGSGGASESKTGSALLFPRWLSGAQGSTSINITNTHPAQDARVRIVLNAISPATAVSDKIVTIKARQTVSIDAASFGLGQKGWAFAMAINSGAQPIRFDYLIGSVHNTDASGVISSLSALAIGKNSDGPVDRNTDLVSANLLFDDVNYDRLPATVALAAIQNTSGVNSALGYMRVSSSLQDVPSARGGASVSVYDNASTQYSALLGLTDYSINTFRSLRFSPTLSSTALDPGSAWLKLPMSTPLLATTSAQPLSGIFTNATDTWTGGFIGSSNLHILSSVDKFSIIVPAGNPGNHAPTADFVPLDTLIEARAKSGTTVRLDGTLSSDPDPGDSLTYQWFDNDVLISTAPIADYRLSIGSHTIKLVVMDSSGEFSEPFLETVAVADKTPPVISRIPTSASYYTSESSVTLNYTMPVAFDAIDGPVTVTSNRPSGSAVGMGGTTVTFTATDKSGNKATVTWDISVSQGSGAPSGGAIGASTPFIANLDDQYLKPGEVRKITLQADDADGNPVTFRVTGALNVLVIGNPDPVARKATLFIGPLSAGFASQQFRIVAFNSKGLSYTTLPFTVAVSSVSNLDNTGAGGGISNAPPVPVVAPLPASIEATDVDGIQLTLDGSASTDANQDSLTYTWLDNGVQIGQGAVLNQKFSVGQHSIVLTVNDGRGGVVSSAPSVIQVLPRPLSILSITPQRLPRGTDTIVTVSGTGFQAGVKLYLGNDVIISAPATVNENSFSVVVSVFGFATTGSRDAVVISSSGKTASLRAGVTIQ